MKGFFIAISILSLILFSSGCKKIEPDSLPVIIESVRSLSLSRYEVIFSVEYADLYNIKSVTIVFDDITILSAADITKEFSVDSERNQTDTIVVETGRLTHDYFITAFAETKIGPCKSEPFLLRSEKNKFFVDVLPDITYSDLRHNIADIVNQRDSFAITVNFINPYDPSLVNVKLNRTKVLNHHLDLKNYWYGNNLESVGYAEIPPDTDPGTYDVFLYIDGMEFKSVNKIIVPEGRWSRIDPDYPGGTRGDYAWFLKGEDLYIIGGESYASQITSSPVYKYNILQNQWERKNNFPHPGEIINNRIMPLNLEHNGDGYVVLKNDQVVELWKYNDMSDQWSFLATYPGKGKDYLTGFISNGKLYIGGGRWIEYYQDLWSFDLGGSEWERKSDIPVKLSNMANQGSLAVVVNAGKVFIFPFTGELWQYDPEGDTWTQKARFPGHERFTTSITHLNNKLYLIGGSYNDAGYYGLKDCWEYNPDNDTWQIMAFLPELYSNGVAFTFQGSVYSGLGWVIDGFSYYFGQNFYKLDL